MQSRLVQFQGPETHLPPADLRSETGGRRKLNLTVTWIRGTWRGVGEGGRDTDGLQEPPDSQVGYLCYMQVCSEGRVYHIGSQTKANLPSGDMSQPLERHLSLS